MVILTSMGVPVILGKNGMQRVIKLELEEDDKARFDISQKEDRKTLTLLK